MLRSRPIPTALLALSLLAACDKGEAETKDAEAKTDAAKTDAAKAETKDGEDSAAKKGGDAKAAALHPDDQELADRRSKDQLEHDPAAVKKTHDEMVALLAEARKLGEAGDTEAAVAKYEALLKLDPHYRPALIEAGELEAKAGDWVAAVHHTKLAAKLTADDDAMKVTLLDRVGQYADKEGKKNDAAHYYREALELKPAEGLRAEIQGRLDALGDVAPELDPPDGPPGSVDSLHLISLLSGTAEDVCAQYPKDGLCVPEECNFIAPGDGSWGVFEVGDGSTNCYHPAVRTGESDWHVYASALMDARGEEVHQSVDRLELKVVEAEGGPFLVIGYAEHLYERVWDDELGDEPIEEDVIDAEGVIVCQRVGDKTRCTDPIITNLNFEIGTQTGKFSAELGYGPDQIVMSKVVKEGKADAAVRTYFYGVLFDEGPHSLPKAI